MPELDDVSVAESPDIICVVETWLCNSISDYEIVLPGYQCVRCDRDCHGGGVLMYIKSFLAFDLLCPDVVGIELLVVSVSSYKSSSKLCLAVYYRPPSSGVDSFSFLSAALMSLNPTVFDKFILLGDFNVNYFCSGSFLYSHLLYTIAPFHLTQIVTSGTHSGNTTLIDYVFVSDISFLSCWSLIPPLGNSDHNGIQVDTYFLSNPLETQSISSVRFGVLIVVIILK